MKAAWSLVPLLLAPVLGQSDPPSAVPSAPSNEAPTLAPTIGGSLPKEECYTNTTAINKWFDYSNPFVQKEIIVCPGTTMNLGFPDSQGEYDDNEQEPLAPRKNSIIKCGQDGSQSNNCTIVGGRLQMLITYVSFEDYETSENIIIQGFVFKQSQVGGVLVDNPGSIKFVDCAFTDHVCGAPMAFYNMLNRDLGDGRRNLIKMDDSFYQMGLGERTKYLAEFYVPKVQERAEEYHKALEDGRDTRGLLEAPLEVPGGTTVSVVDRSHRNLQVPTRLLITLENSLVANNAQAPRGQVTNFGYIQLAFTGNDLTLINTTFSDNQFGDPSFSLVGYAVESDGDNFVQIQDSCFIDNNFIGLGTVRIVAGGTVNATNNYGTLDTGLTCQFIGYKESEEGAATCINYDRTTCINEQEDPLNTTEPGTNSTDSGAMRCFGSTILGMTLLALWALL